VRRFAGLVAHYFDDKDGLLEATFRSLSGAWPKECARDWVWHALHAAGSVVIDTNLAPEEFDKRTGTAWLAFWGQVLHVHGLKRVQTVYQRRMVSNLCHALRRLLPANEARSLAAMIAAMIDGVWLRARCRTGRRRIARARGAVDGIRRRRLRECALTDGQELALVRTSTPHRSRAVFAAPIPSQRSIRRPVRSSSFLPLRMTLIFFGNAQPSRPESLVSLHQRHISHPPLSSSAYTVESFRLRFGKFVDEFDPVGALWAANLEESSCFRSSPRVSSLRNRFSVPRKLRFYQFVSIGKANDCASCTSDVPAEAFNLHRLTHMPLTFSISSARLRTNNSHLDRGSICRRCAASVPELCLWSSHADSSSRANRVAFDEELPISLSATVGRFRPRCGLVSGNKLPTGARGTPPGRLAMNICKASVEPMESRISTPKRSLKRWKIGVGKIHRRKLRDAQARDQSQVQPPADKTRGTRNWTAPRKTAWA